MTVVIEGIGVADAAELTGSDDVFEADIVPISASLRLTLVVAACRLSIFRALFEAVLPQ